MRDIDKYIERGEAILSEHKRLELNVSEVLGIYEKALRKDEETGVEIHDTLLLVDAAYKVGFAVGYRWAKREAKASK